jgi:hypothetical protein
MFKKVLNFLQSTKKILTGSARSKAVDILEWEKTELENIFSLLVLGSFVGIPSTPTSITLNLLPYMENEIQLMIDKVATASGPISDLFSHMDTP